MFDFLGLDCDSCDGIMIKNESSQFLVYCSAVNRMQYVRSASTTNGSQTWQCTCYKAGEAKLLSRYFLNSGGVLH